MIVIDPVIGALHESGSRLWLGPPKTAASVRTITLPPFLITLLGEHLETSDENAVFAGPRGGWLRRSNVYRRALRPAADGNLHIANPRVRALPIRPGLTFHGLRHSHKTWLIDDGMPEIAQARRLGHHLPLKRPAFSTRGRKVPGAQHPRIGLTGSALLSIAVPRPRADRAECPARVAAVTIHARTSSRGSKRISAANTSRSCFSNRGRLTCRRSTAFAVQWRGHRATPSPPALRLGVSGRKHRLADSPPTPA